MTYLVVGWLERVERADVFDAGTNFNPFAWLGEGVAERAGSGE